MNIMKCKVLITLSDLLKVTCASNKLESSIHKYLYTESVPMSVYVNVIVH